MRTRHDEPKQIRLLMNDCSPNYASVNEWLRGNHPTGRRPWAFFCCDDVVVLNANVWIRICMIHKKLPSCEYFIALL